MKKVVCLMLALTLAVMGQRPVLEVDVVVTDAGDGFVGLSEISTPALATNTIARVKGGTVPGDGGGGNYLWDGSAWSRYLQADYAKTPAPLKIPKAVPVLSDGAYNAFPGIAELEGRLVVAYRAGTEHIGAAEIHAIYSDDYGRSWSAPIAIYDAASHDPRDVGLSIVTVGGVQKFCSAFVVEQNNDINDRDYDAFYVLSDDGVTWGTPIAIGTPSNYFWTTPITELSNGDWIGAAYTFDTDPQVPYAVRSTDQGATWSAGIAMQSYCNETQILVLENGDLIGYHRHSQGSADTLASTSDDNGLTWTNLALTENRQSRTQGIRPNVIELPDGRFLRASRSDSGVDDGRANGLLISDDGVVWEDYAILDPRNSDYMDFVVVGEDVLAVFSAIDSETVASLSLINVSEVVRDVASEFPKSFPYPADFTTTLDDLLQYGDANDWRSYEDAELLIDANFYNAVDVPIDLSSRGEILVVSGMTFTEETGFRGLKERYLAGATTGTILANSTAKYNFLHDGGAWTMAVSVRIGAGDFVGLGVTNNATTTRNGVAMYFDDRGGLDEIVALITKSASGVKVAEQRVPVVGLRDRWATIVIVHEPDRVGEPNSLRVFVDGAYVGGGFEASVIARNTADQTDPLGIGDTNASEDGDADFGKYILLPRVVADADIPHLTQLISR